MCDFSLHAVRSRPAKVGDKLTTRMFNLGTGGFCAPEDMGIAVCLLPGTELSFTDEVRRWSNWLRPWNETVISYRTAIFRQINKDRRATHHDALEFPNGEIVLLDNPRRRPAGNGAATASGTRKSKGARRAGG